MEAYVRIQLSWTWCVSFFHGHDKHLREMKDYFGSQFQRLAGSIALGVEGG